MAVASTKMKSVESSKAVPAAPKTPPTEAQLHAAFRKRGEVILENVTRQTRNLEKLMKSNKATGSDKQKTALKAALVTLCERITAAANDKATPAIGGIPDE